MWLLAHCWRHDPLRRRTPADLHRPGHHEGRPIIILDEATANVDPENEKELMGAVSELTHDKTV